MTTRLLAAAFALALAAQSAPAYGHGDLDHRLARASARIEAAPGDPSLWVRRAALHREHRDFARAFADLDRARALDEVLPAQWYVRGLVLLDARRPAEAERALARCLALAPRHSSAHAARGRALVALGRPALAARAYTRALADTPVARPELYLARARALEAAGEPAEALRGLDEGLARLGPVVTLQREALRLETRLGRFDRALARLDRILAGAARPEHWLARRGDILAAAGRTDEALRAYEAARRAVTELSPHRRGTASTRTLEARLDGAIAELRPNPLE